MEDRRDDIFLVLVCPPSFDAAASFKQLSISPSKRPCHRRWQLRFVSEIDSCLVNGQPLTDGGGQTMATLTWPMNGSQRKGCLLKNRSSWTVACCQLSIRLSAGLTFPFQDSVKKTVTCWSSRVDQYVTADRFLKTKGNVKPDEKTLCTLPSLSKLAERSQQRLIDRSLAIHNQRSADRLYLWPSEFRKRSEGKVHMTAIWPSLVFSSQKDQRTVI